MKFSRKLEDHINHVPNILTMLENSPILLKNHKCQFFGNTLECLGRVLLPRRIAIAKHATSSIAYTKLLEDMTQLCFFLGAFNICKRSIKYFLQMTDPLTR